MKYSIKSMFLWTGLVAVAICLTIFSLDYYRVHDRRTQVLRYCKSYYSHLDYEGEALYQIYKTLNSSTYWELQDPKISLAQVETDNVAIRIIVASFYGAKGKLKIRFTNGSCETVDPTGCRHIIFDKAKLTILDLRANLQSFKPEQIKEIESVQFVCNGKESESKEVLIVNSDMRIFRNSMFRSYSLD